jgi:putative ABC transport system substrate-binding protein
MRRREFITLVGGAAAWPLAARAQQGDRMRLIGVLLPLAKDEPRYQPWLTAFRQVLQELGWVDGRNIRMDIHWATNHAEIRKQAAELVALAPDVILAHGASTVGPLLQTTRTVPIVFPIAGDPVGAGFVDSLARPGGNVTGFMTFEYSMSGKYVELLKQIAPGVARAAVIRDAGSPTGVASFGRHPGYGAVAQGRGDPGQHVPNAGEIERVVTAFAQSSNGGLIVTASGAALVNRDLIIALAARHKLPAVYFERSFVAAGGLVSYGADFSALYRKAAGYVDRILKGDKPADLPVQTPTKYETVINLKTAKALGLTVPQAWLATTDDVIE